MAPPLFRIPVPILSPLQAPDDALNDVFNGRLRPRQEKEKDSKDKSDQVHVCQPLP